MHTKNSSVLPKPKCKTCHEHQGHTHCQSNPAHRAVMICGQDTHRCPQNPPTVLLHFCALPLLLECHLTLSFFPISSLIPPSSNLKFPYVSRVLISTPIFFILFVFLLGLESLESPIFHLALLVCLRTTYSHPSGAPVFPHPSRG